jgi:hypothetical protein
LPERYFLDGNLDFRPAALDRCQKRKRTVPCQPPDSAILHAWYEEFYSGGPVAQEHCKYRWPAGPRPDAGCPDLSGPVYAPALSLWTELLPTQL